MERLPIKHNSQIPKDLKIVCIDLADMFALNWMRYNTLEWKNQMSGMLMSTFLETFPNTVKKAGLYVIQNNKDEFPPSMGKIIQSMRDYIGTGKARTPKVESCERCSDGFIKICFWFNLNGSNVFREINSSCSECEKGKLRKSKLRLLDNVETLRKIQNKEIYSYEDENFETQSLIDYNEVTIRKRISGEWKVSKVTRGVWVQTQKGELPPLEITAPDISNKVFINEHSKLKEEREKKNKHMLGLIRQEKILLEEKKLQLLNTYKELDNATKVHETHELTSRIKILTEDIERTEHGLQIEYITLDEYLKAKQIERDIIR